MTIKLWHQSVTELKRDNSYSKALLRRAEAVLPGQVTIDTFGLPPGSYGGLPPSSLLGNAFMYHRILSQFIDQAIDAQRQGYDGFVIGSFADPLITEIRAAVDIPVTSLLETSLLVGCSYGQKIALITTAPNVEKMIRRSLANYQLQARVSDVISVSPALLGPVLHNAFEEPQPALERFEQAARQALANGADVIVPAEGILAVLLADRGITRFENAPVLDVFGVTWSYALMLANLRARAGLSITRRGNYEQPNPEYLAVLRGY
jgi:Asp/Glu/hydantoin racemase